MLRVIFSSKLDPYFNLALEHFYLYRDKEIEQMPVLIIYQNAPSVVLGNFQNPWLEVNIPFCRSHNINIVRRFSGGGCVYHDLGNINFCYIGPKTEDSKIFLHSLIINFLKARNINLNIGEKSDLLYKTYKISGSAFRDIKNRTLHHCTLLFNSDLKILKGSLSSVLKGTSTLSTKALGSRPALVKCIQEISPQWNSSVDLIHDFINNLSDAQITVSDFVEGGQYWSSWEQIYGKTPQFTWKFSDIEILVENGILEWIAVNDKRLDDFPRGIQLARGDNQWKNYIKNIFNQSVLKQWEDIGFF